MHRFVLKRMVSKSLVGALSKQIAIAIKFESTVHSEMSELL